MSKNTLILQKLKELCVLHKESVTLLGRSTHHLTLFMLGNELEYINLNQQLKAHYTIAEEYKLFIIKCSDFLTCNSGAQVNLESTPITHPLLWEAIQLIVRFKELIKDNKAVLTEVEQISGVGMGLVLCLN